jgi:hypothetical protein
MYGGQIKKITSIEDLVTTISNSGPTRLLLLDVQNTVINYGSVGREAAEQLRKVSTQLHALISGAVALLLTNSREPFDTGDDPPGSIVPENHGRQPICGIPGLYSTVCCVR